MYKTILLSFSVETEKADRLASQAKKRIKNGLNCFNLERANVDGMIDQEVKYFRDILQAELHPNFKSENVKRGWAAFIPRTVCMVNEAILHLKQGKTVYLIAGAHRLPPIWPADCSSDQIKKIYSQITKVHTAFKDFSFTILHSDQIGEIDATKLIAGVAVQ